MIPPIASELLPEIVQAQRRICPHLAPTLLRSSPYYGERNNASVYFKCDNLQPTGSFKVRGALNHLLSLGAAERAKGVVAASTGNHGAAVAYGAGKLGVDCTVFVPENASKTKIAAMERLGAEVRQHGQDPVESELFARRFAGEQGMAYISPYNDRAIIAGQGTLGAELAEQLENIDSVFIALGGGGLTSGVAACLKALRPGVRIVACSPENSAVMMHSVQAGEILDLPSLPTLSDGTAGGVEKEAITFDYCRQLVDDYVTVTEAEIAASLRQFMEVHHMMIEGAAAVPIAAYLKLGADYHGQNVVIVLCGANIDLGTLRAVLA
jgi:threonine dehydratase